jgi:hypothetical protein
MALLRPLLLDNVPSIQQSAALALGRLANYSDELAEAVVSNEILPQLVYSLSEQNVSYIFIFKSNLKIGNRHSILIIFLNIEILQKSCCLRFKISC